MRRNAPKIAFAPLWVKAAWQSLPRLILTFSSGAPEYDSNHESPTQGHLQ
jgi:hypothetical protein